MSTSGNDFLDAVLRNAAARPDAPAVLEADRTWTYSGLVQRARRVASALVQAGVGPGEVVAVPAQRGGETIAKLLGILIRDATYVVFDPADPAARIETILAQAGVRLVLDGAAAAGPSDEGPVTRHPGIRGFVHDPLAYIVFTSGSTGVPKGVMVTRAALTWHARTVSAAYGLVAGDVVLQAASLVFDVAAEEIWPTLASGAALSVPGSPIGSMSFDQLTTHVRQRSVTLCNLPSSFFTGWVATLKPGDVPPAVRCVVVGSEPLAASAVAHWRQVTPEVPLVNAYGLSEATITSLIHPVDDQLGDQVPVGAPLPGMTARIVDPAGRPVPSGARGELALAGAGLALGYTDPTHDAGRFVVADLGDGERRWLRTGDLAREVDGRIVLDGRIDDQVKIAGRRIEPREIVQALLSQPEVSDARVVVTDGRLVACVVGQGAEPAVLNRLRTVLPEHLIPAVVRWYGAFPRSPGGKVDRQALEADAAELLRTSSRDLIDPDAMLALWRDLLPGPVENDDADFFDAGGDSLQAGLLLLRLRRDWGVTLTIIDLFTAPRLGDFQRLVAARGQSVNQ